MSRRQVIVLWAIAIILVGALIAVKSSKKEGYQAATERSRGQTLLEDFNPDEVAQIVINDGDQSTTLEKDEGVWNVASRDAYPGNTSNINDLLRTIAEVKITQGIEADPSFAPRFGMDATATDPAERGTKVVLSNDAGTELASLDFGRNLEGASNPMSPFGGGGGSSGRFIKNTADSSGVYVTSELFPTLTTDPARWLKEDFLKIEKIESITMSEPGKPDTIEWSLSRKDETAQFELEGKKDNENLDDTVLNPLKSIFSYARFEDIIPAAEAADAWNKDTKQQAVIKTFEGFTYTIELGPAKAEEPKEGDTVAPTERYLMTVKVDATVPAERKKEDGDSDEQNKEKDEAFAKRKAELEEKLATTKALEGRTYQVSKFTIDALLKNRIGLIKSAPPAGAPQPGMPGMVPGGRPRQAVTPPIAIPPMPPQQ